MFNWKQGRQHEGYFTLKLFSFWRIDGYLIKCNKGVEISPHVDIVQGKRHFRLNILLSGDDCFWMKNKPIFKIYRLTLFRPDLYIHGTNAGGGWLMLSFGIAI